MKLSLSKIFILKFSLLKFFALNLCIHVKHYDNILQNVRDLLIGRISRAQPGRAESRANIALTAKIVETTTFILQIYVCQIYWTEASVFAGLRGYNSDLNSNCSLMSLLN